MKPKEIEFKQTSEEIQSALLPIFDKYLDNKPALIDALEYITAAAKRRVSGHLPIKGGISSPDV